MRARVGPAAWIVGAAFCWSLLGPVSRLAFQEGISPMEVAFWRAALGSVMFGVHAAVIRTSLPARRHLPVFAAFALVGGSLFFASYQLAVEAGGAAIASVLLYTAPAWVIIAAAIVLGERVTGRKLIALALTLTGIVLIAQQSGDVAVSTSALVWGLLAGVSYASYYIFGRRYFDRYKPEMVYAVVFPIAAITLLPLVPFAPKSNLAWVAILGVSVVSTYVAYLIYGIGLRRLEAGRASLFATIEPVSATIIASIWWSERLAPGGYIGAVLVLIAVVIALERRAAPPPESPREEAER